MKLKLASNSDGYARGEVRYISYNSILLRFYCKEHSPLVSVEKQKVNVWLWNNGYHRCNL